MFNSDLICSINGQPMTSSILVADKFGKRHDNVLRAIRNVECSDSFRQLNFALVMESMTYIDSNGKSKTKETKRVASCMMTKDGFVFLVMAFTGKKAAAFKEDYINEFNRMADHLNSTRFAYIELQAWESKEVNDKFAGSYHGKGLRHRRLTKNENQKNIHRLEKLVQPTLTGFNESITQLEVRDGK